MVNIVADHFSIRQICESGQCFRLQKVEETAAVQKREENQRDEQNCAGDKISQTPGEKYALTALGHYLEIWQRENQLSFDCTPEEFEQVWKRYFDLEEDYGRIIASIDSKDEYLVKAAAYGSGIRILRQDLWETIISFIISQQNNIKRIRKCIHLLCRRYGEERTQGEGRSYYLFPAPEALAGASIEDLYACNLGYRSKYVRKTAQSIASGEFDLKAVKELGYEAAMTELLKLSGVGEKVASCICLFALHQTQAFPVDTHINKVLKQQYPGGFPFERYAGYAGTIQQYIFYYDLTQSTADSLRYPGE